MLLILASPHVLLEPSGRERGRSIPFATNFSLAPDVSFWGEADLGRAAEFAASVENGPNGDIDGPPNRRVPQPLPRANLRSCNALS